MGACGSKTAAPLEVEATERHTGTAIVGLVDLLKAASCDCMPAFYSLDSPWCFDFVIKAGVDVDGDKRVRNAWAC